MESQAVFVLPASNNFSTGPSARLIEPEVHQFPQVSQSQQAEQTSYPPRATISTRIPANHNLPNLRAWTFSVQTTSH